MSKRNRGRHKSRKKSKKASRKAERERLKLERENMDREQTLKECGIATFLEWKQARFNTRWYEVQFTVTYSMAGSGTTTRYEKVRIPGRNERRVRQRVKSVFKALNVPGLLKVGNVKCIGDRQFNSVTKVWED